MTLTYPAQYVVDEQNRKTAVLLPVAVYQQLLDDLHDLAVVAQRREDSTINLAEMISRLGIDDDIQHSISSES